MAEQPESPDPEAADGTSADPVLILLQECLLRPEGEQQEALEEVCRRHPETADELRECWTQLRKMGLAGLASEQEPFPERLGEFRLLERLGGGGMGVVYLAEQIHLNRQVALKVIRPEHLYFPATRERFRREVRAVARLQHPGIVPIYTVGEHEGIPYFAMERIQGCTLAELLDAVRDRPAERLTGRDMAETVVRICAGSPSQPVPPVYAEGWVESSLRIALQVADALRHAHERGILHRDIKPSNIMLTPDGRALLLDFGLASSQGTEKLTRTGSAPGSLLYMSPEQIRGEELDVRTDLYSLGVTLYELLSLREAFLARDPEALRRQILNGQVVPVRQHNRRVPSDAETVCLAAMEVDRRRRYQDAGALHEDLGNLLEHRPIRARSPGRLLRLHRWTQRHPTSTVALLLGVLLLVGLPTGLLIQERSSRAAIEAEAEVARRVTEFLVGLFENASPRRSLGEDLPVGLLLDQGAQRIERELEDQPVVRARLLLSLGRAYYWVGAYHKSESFLRQALELETRRLGPHHLRVLNLQESLGITLTALGAYEETEHLHRRTLETLREMLGPAHPEIATSMRHLGNALGAMGRTEEAESILRESAEMYRSFPEQDPLGFANALSDLAALHHLAGRNPVARELLEESLGIWTDTCDQGHATIPIVLNSMARVQEALGDSEAAEASIQRALEEAERIYGAHHPDVATLLVTHSTMLRVANRRDEAEQKLRRAIQIQERILGDDHPELAWSRADLGSLLYELGRFEDAVELLEQSVATSRETYQADHPSLAIPLRCLAQALAGQGRIPQAEKVARESLAMQRRLEAHPGSGTVHAILVLSWVLLVQGRFEEAGTLCREAVAVLGDLPDQHGFLAEAWNQLALIEVRRGNGPQAETAGRRALEALAEPGPGSHVQGAYAFNLVAWALLLDGHLEEAEPLFLDSIDTFGWLFPDGHPDQAFPLTRLGMAWLPERIDDALPLLEEALDIRGEFLSPLDPWYSLSLHNLGMAWYQKGDDAAAWPLLEEALELRLRQLRRPHPDLATTLYYAALVKLREEDHEAAAELAEDCLGQQRLLRPGSDLALAGAAGLLGECWTRLGRHEDAEPLLLEARSSFTSPSATESQRADSVRRLIELYEEWGKPAEAEKYRAELASLASGAR